MKEDEIKLTHNPARGAHVLKTRALIFSNDQEYWFKFIADTSETFTGTITIVAKKSGASYDLTSDMRWRVPDELLGYVGMVTAEVVAHGENGTDNLQRFSFYILPALGQNLPQFIGLTPFTAEAALKKAILDDPTLLGSAQGVKGDKGDKGEKGDTGEQGIQRLKGDKGDKGDTGEQGLPGKQGDPGADGKDGAPGEKGDTGDAASVDLTPYPTFSDMNDAITIATSALPDAFEDWANSRFAPISAGVKATNIQQKNNQYSATIAVGGTFQMVPVLTPSDATDKVDYYYDTSKNSVVATVDDSGLVTGLNPGTTIIYMSTVQNSTFDRIGKLDGYVQGFVPIYGVHITVTAT